MDTDVEPIADVDGDPVDEDPPVPHMFPGLFEEEEDEPHEEEPIPVLNRFLAFRIVYGNGLRRIPSVG